MVFIRLCKAISLIFAFLLIIVIGYLVFLAIPSKYTAEAISGVVLDKITGQPVTGAVVVVTWYSQSPGFHSPNREIFEIQEAVSDSQGRYIISGWTAKRLQRYAGSFASDQPEILAYKHGYKPTYRSNFIPQYIKGRAKSTHDSIIRWYQPTEIVMDQLVGHEKEKIDFFDGIKSFRPSIYDGCDWKKTINLILEIDRQEEKRENYFAGLYKEDSHGLTGTINLYTPWYLQQGYPEHSPDCPGAIELLSNARKLRSKDKE